MPSSPDYARFLNAEKAYVKAVLRVDGSIGADEQSDSFSWAEVGKALASMQVFLCALACFMGCITPYSLAYFTPSTIQSLGYTAARAQLMSMPPFSVAFVVSMIGAYLSDRSAGLAGQKTVAVRMPSHPVALAHPRQLVQVSALAALSANSSGKPSPTRAEQVMRNLEGHVAVVLDGGAFGVGVESTVVDGLHPDGAVRVLRPDGVTVEDLERVIRKELGGAVPRVLVHRCEYADEAIESAPTTADRRTKRGARGRRVGRASGRSNLRPELGVLHHFTQRIAVFVVAQTLAAR
ncbi:unnamed protein product [Mycena citricolor]|uniref:Threonylcarbamoyl-AMP synthase n=1 Tax=Mycena citricolor TaxID=2018698 RepID=A0AAD2Q6X2_9AGAR|nr:unnamed protein product [Mycena citricolor]